MDGRAMAIAFEELIRTTYADLEFDTNINTDVIFQFLTRAEEEYIVDNFLSGDSIVDNINAIRKRSDVLRKIINRSTATVAESGISKQIDGGYLATITESDYWMFLSGVLSNASLPTNDKGSTETVIELDLINHYDLQKKVRTVNNEPIFKYIPIVLEGANNFVFYLDKEKLLAIGDINIAGTAFEIIYLAHPPGISNTSSSALAESTHNDIVKRAVEIFIADYRFRLGVTNPKENG